MSKTTFCLVMMLTLFGLRTNAQIVINEILASNESINQDEDGSYQDWVELYNPGPAAVNLDGWGLSDDPADPFKWTFPNVSMAANTYLLVWCSDKDRTAPGSPLHTNWKISASGEAVTLTHVNGTTADASPAVPQLSNVSFGRLPNGSGPFVFFTDVTPNAANAASGYSETLPAPEFSHNSGFSTAGFNLTISTSVAGATVLYTLDGSEPDPANIGGKTYSYKNQYPEMPGDPFGPMLSQTLETLEYSAPIAIVDRSSQPNKISGMSTTFDYIPTYIPESPIFKGTVVRAKVIKPGALDSPTVSKTFFVTPEGAERFSLPVVSISIDEDKLFEYENGIMTAGVDFDEWRIDNPDMDPIYQDVGNFHREGSTTERTAHFSYLVDGVEVLNQNIGIRIKGASSRDYPSKSFNLYARAEHGADTFDYPMFSDLPNSDYERLQLRNSGGDFWQTMFRDAYNQEISKHLRVERESYQPAVVFINGEYWGILNMREKFDNNYFSQILDIDDVDLLENNWQYPSVEEGDGLDWADLYQYMMSNSLASDENLEYISTRIDIDNFIDYFAAQIYLDNGDWPGTNVLFWRKKTDGLVPDAPYGHDGRWRWAFHDLDDTMGNTTTTYDRNSLEAATATDGPDWPNPPASTLFLRRFFENESFRTQFINRFADLMNTSFLSTRMMAVFNQMNGTIEGEIPDHIARWEAPASLNDRQWFLNWQTGFISARPEIQRTHIREKFEIDSNIDITLDVSDPAHGFVHINTIDIADGTPGIDGNPYPWTGVYFSNIPVTVKAVAHPGYQFDHWSGASNSTEEEITISMASSFELTAHFVPAEPGTITEPIYFWMMDSTMPNDTPLTNLDATYEVAGDAGIDFTSSLAGYPFDPSHPNWRTGSMERRNSPTDLNYIPEANNDTPFESSNMRGLQITQPFQNGDLENTLVFHIPSTGYKNIIFAFAAKDEGAADAIVIDYSTSAGAPSWTTAGITSTLPLSGQYQIFTTDLSAIEGAENNPNLKVRLRFTGADMTADNGDRVTFNNISVTGVEMILGVPESSADIFAVYPNPASQIINVAHNAENATFRMLSIDGKLVKQGSLQNPQIDISDLNNGIYLLQVTSGAKSQTKKIVKQ